MILSFSKKFPWGELTNFVQKIKDNTKIHTIRKDSHERWRPGMAIHFATGVRTPNYDNFLMDECQAVEEVWIHPEHKIVSVFKDEGYGKWYEVDVDEFAKNDGFDSTEDFWRWFDKECYRRLIHWTEKRYID